MRVSSKVLAPAIMIALVALICPALAFAQGGSSDADLASGSARALEPTVSPLQTQASQIYYVSGLSSTVTYTGDPITFDLVVYNENWERLTEWYDYYVSYDWNTDVGTARVTVYGMGSYSGSSEVDYFDIDPAYIWNATVSNVKSKTYTGSALTQSPTVTFNYETLTEGVDYELSYSNNTNAGTATVTVTGIGNFTDTTNEYFTIYQADISTSSGITIDVNRQLYNGLEKTPDPTVKFNGTRLSRYYDYDCTYANNRNPGTNTASVTVTGAGNFTGSKTVYFTIYGADISGASVYAVYDKTYDGTAKTQSPTVYFNGNRLTEGVDYSLSYSNNVNAGTASLIVKGLGVYSYSQYVSFEIEPRDIDEASVSSVANQLYTGSRITPSPTVTYGGKTLTKGVDYTLYYEDNLEPGYATITVEGIGNFDGETDVSFYISKSDLGKASLSMSKKSFTYTGGGITPRPKVVYNGRTLSLWSDYTLEYSRNVNVGTATVKVVGAGGYAGSTIGKFKITKADFKKAKVKISPSAYAYKGKNIVPKAVVTFKGTTLKAGRDYKITSKAKNVGDHTAKVAGLRNFKGSVVKSFKINPKTPKVTIAKPLRVSSSGAAQVSWTKITSNCSGYDVWVSSSYRFKGGDTHKQNWSTKSNQGKNCSFRGSGLKKGTYYYVKVRAYRQVGSKIYRSEWSPVRGFRTYS